MIVELRIRGAPNDIQNYYVLIDKDGSEHEIGVCIRMIYFIKKLFGGKQ